MPTLNAALLMTALGMGLVFAIIILLTALTELLMRVTADPTPPAPAPATPATLEPATTAPHTRRAVALAAVAFALARAAHADTHLPATTPPGARVSAWQAVMRTRQMRQNVVRPRTGGPR